MPHILVIEDDEEVRSLISEFLVREGHEVHEAGNGLEGTEVFDQLDIDIVITDIMMPSQDGVETIRALKERDPGVRAIAITGYRGSYNRLPAAEFVGAKQTLVKPFTKEELVEAVNAVLAL
jgi:two-component system, chemotaxis family, chemotaxis protein CheY